VAAATTALDDDPGNPRLAERLGRALLAAGRTGDAQVSLRMAAEFAHYDAGVQVAYGVALFASGRPLSAREAYGRALALDPAHAGAHAELRRLGDAERDIVDAATLVRITDKFAESLRVPAGGRVRTDRRAAVAHVAGVSQAVCLLTLLVLAVVATGTATAVPPALILLLVALVGVASAVRARTRRRR
jgi:Flp pilus assembly protein TadD